MQRPRNGFPSPRGLLKSQPSAPPSVSPPFLGSFFGTGYSLRGRSRETDTRDSSSVKNRVFSFCFLPLFAIDAYRVKKVDYTDNLLFIKKEKLSVSGRIANTIAILTLSSLLASTAIVSYTHSERYQTHSLFSEANQLIQNNKTSQGLELYLEAYQLVSDERKPEIIRNFTLATLDTYQTNDWIEIEKCSGLLIKSPFFNEVKTQFPELNRETINRAKEIAEQSPETALLLMQLAELTAAKDLDWSDDRKAILEGALTNSEIFDESAVDQLSSLYESSGETDKLLQLLEPLSDKISGSEMALRLGIAQMKAEQINQATRNFNSYLTSREQAWIDASRHLSKDYELTIEQLDSRNASETLYENAYQFHTGQQSLTQWQKVLNQTIQSNPNNQSYLDLLKKTKRVPEALMNLTICHLKLANSKVSDPKKQLQQAENTLLKLSHIASDSPEYQFFLGQVYYWLGKNQPARSLFRTLTRQYKSDATQLLNIARALRDIGLMREARPIANQAYAAAGDENQQQDIAYFISTLTTDKAEQVEWLKKANPNSPNVLTDLYSARGELAISKNEITAGVNQLKKAISNCEKQAESASSLNNGALLHFKLFHATGSTSNFKTGLMKIEKAARLLPNDPILNSNAATLFFEAACQEILKRKLEPSVIRNGINVSHLDYLHNTEREYFQLTEKLKAHPHYKKACHYFKRSLLLAPQDRSLYLQGNSIFAWANDDSRRMTLKQKLQSSVLDDQWVRQQWLESIKSWDIEETNESALQSQRFVQPQINDSKSEFTKAIIAVAKIDLLVEQWPKIKIPDIKETIATLEQLNSRFPNTKFANSLRAAIAVHAAQAIAAKHPLFKQWVIDARDQVSLESLLLLWMVNQQNPSSILQKYSPVKDFCQKSHQQAMKYKSNTNSYDLLVASLIEPSDLAILNAQPQHLTQPNTKSIAEILFHYLPEQKLQQYWKLLAQGQTEQASRYYLTIQNEINSNSGLTVLPNLGPH